jgi:hypothetical protein
VLLVAWWFVPGIEQHWPTDWLSFVQPPWLPILTLWIGAVLMVAPFRWKWVRGAGYLSIFLALSLGGLIYYNAGSLGDVRLGPIPKGTPVNLIANVNSEAGSAALAKAVRTTVAGLAEIESTQADEKKQREIMQDKIAPALLEVSKCPDFVMDRGHYFEWFKSMTDEEKDALIELLKTL